MSIDSPWFSSRVVGSKIIGTRFEWNNSYI